MRTGNNTLGNFGSLNLTPLGYFGLWPDSMSRSPTTGRSLRMARYDTGHVPSRMCVALLMMAED